MKRPLIATLSALLLLAAACTADRARNAQAVAETMPVVEAETIRIADHLNLAFDEGPEVQLPQPYDPDVGIEEDSSGSVGLQGATPEGTDKSELVQAMRELGYEMTYGRCSETSRFTSLAEFTSDGDVAMVRLVDLEDGGGIIIRILVGVDGSVLQNERRGIGACWQ